MGVLISGFSLEQYEKYIKRLNHIYVYEKEDEVIGFLLALEPVDLDYSLGVNRFIKRKASNDFVVLKELCFSKQHYQAGYVSNMYEDFMARTNLDIFLAIELDSYNETMIKYFEKLCFTLINETEENDNISKGVLYWNNPNAQTSYDMDVLLKQYELAHDLYKHEDKLNWTKINYLFYVSASLIAGIVLASNIPGALSLPLGLMIAGLVGFFVSKSFIVAIHSGIEYMKVRKKAYMHIEHLIENRGGVPMVNVIGDKKLMFKKAPTESVLQTLANFIIIMWLSVTILGFFWLIYTIVS